MRKKEEKKSRKILYVIAIIVFALIVVNVLIFTGALRSPGVACYKNACIYGDIDPVQEYRDLISSSDKVILVAEGDVEKTKTTAFIDLSLAQLAQDFGLMRPMIIGIGLEAGNPVACYCEEYADGDFIKCTFTLEQCLEVQPDDSSFMIRLKYPTFGKDEIFINGRTIEVQGMSGEDVLALVYLLRDLRV